MFTTRLPVTIMSWCWDEILPFGNVWLRAESWMQQHQPYGDGNWWACWCCLFVHGHYCIVQFHLETTGYVEVAPLPPDIATTMALLCPLALFDQQILLSALELSLSISSFMIRFVLIVLTIFMKNICVPMFQHCSYKNLPTALMCIADMKLSSS